MATTAIRPVARRVPRSRGVAPWVFVTVAIAGFVPLVALWATDGFGGWAADGGARAIARLLGFAAAYAMLVIVVMAARVPVIERGVGLDRLLRWHGMLGPVAIGLVAAHGLFLLISRGYGRTGGVGRSPGFQPGHGQPTQVLAIVAGVLLLGVAAGAWARSRRRIGYDAWNLTHLVTYLAIGLSLPHQFALGLSLGGGSAAAIAWKATWVIALVVFIACRLALPLVRSLRQRYVVERVVPEAPGVVSLYVTGRRLDRLPARAGQFCRLRFLTPGRLPASNPYSFSADPAGPEAARGGLRFTIKDSGEHSRAVADLRPGARILLEGPYGASTLAAKRHRATVMIAGGIGIAPLRAMLEALGERARDATLLYRAPTDDAVLFRDELAVIEREHGATIHLIVGPQGPGTDLTADRLTRLAPSIGEADVFVCGPPALAAAACSAARAAGAAPRDIHSEGFGW